MANLLASLRESERGDPNLVEGLVSDLSGGGKIVLKRGLRLHFLVTPPMGLMVCDGVKAVILPVETSMKERSWKRFIIAFLLLEPYKAI